MPYCFDTDTLSSILRPHPSLGLIRRLAQIPAEQQFTTSINLGELLYGAARKKDALLASRIRDLIDSLVTILPFDDQAAGVYANLRAGLELQGKTLAEPDLRIAAISIVNNTTLVTGNLRHFQRVPNLIVENWILD